MPAAGCSWGSGPPSSCWAALALPAPGRLPLAALRPLCFLLGLSASGLVLVFACVREVNDPADTGAALALPNAVAFLGIGLLQWGLGRLLDARWAWTMVGGARVNGGEVYREAFAATCGITETRCMVRRGASSARRTER